MGAKRVRTEGAWAEEYKSNRWVSEWHWCLTEC